MADKIYVGSGKEKEMEWGKKIKLFLSNKDLETVMNNKNEKGISLDLLERKEIGKYGETHYMVIDTWKPEAKQEDNKQRDRIKFPVDEISLYNVPF